MIDILVFVILGAALFWRIREKWSAARTGHRPAPEPPNLSWPRLVVVLLLTLTPLVWHMIAFASYLRERGLSFFFDSLDIAQTWAFLRAGGYVYGLLEIMGVLLAMVVIFSSPDHPREHASSEGCTP